MPSNPKFYRYFEKAPLVVAFAWMGFAGNAQAESIVVDRTDDLPAVNPAIDAQVAGGGITLRSALQRLNQDTNTDDDEIVLSASSVYTLNYGAGVLDNTSYQGDLDWNRDQSYGNLTIRTDVAGTRAFIDATGLNDRVLHVLVNPTNGTTYGNLTLRDLEIYGGFADDDGSSFPSEARGGGLLYAYGGLVTLDNTLIRNNTARGQDGTNGNDAFTTSIFIGSTPLPFPSSSSSTPIFTTTTISAGNGSSGYGAAGGGIYIGGGTGYGGLVLINGSGIEGNEAFGGRGGDGGDTNGFGGTAGDAGDGGSAFGGGVFIANGIQGVSVDGGSISNNEADGGDGGRGGDADSDSGSSNFAGDAGEGGDAMGGGLFASVVPAVDLTDTNVTGNVAEAGDGGNHGDQSRSNATSSELSGEYGGTAFGGGLYVSDSDLTVLGGQITGNSAVGGDGGYGGDNGETAGYGGDGGNAYGGGAYVNNGAVTLTDVIAVSSNRAEGGVGGRGGYATSSSDGGDGGNGGHAYGGGLFQSNGSLDIEGTSFRAADNAALGGDGGYGGNAREDTGGDGGDGGEARGGAIYQVSGSSFTQDLTDNGYFGFNVAIGGDGGNGGYASTEDTGGDGGDGGDARGGGIYTDAPTVEFYGSATFVGNDAYGGHGGHGGYASEDAGGDGGHGGDAYGGGLYVPAGTLLFDNSVQFGSPTVFDFGNVAYGGDGGNGGTAESNSSSSSSTEAEGGDGGNAAGGSIYHTGSSLTVNEASTFFSGVAVGGAGGEGGYAADVVGGNGGEGGDAFGGAIYTTADSVALVAPTFDGNSAAGGHGGYGGDAGGGTGFSGPSTTFSAGDPGDGGDGGNARGGALYSTAASSVTLSDVTATFNEAIGGYGGDGGYASVSDGSGGDGGDAFGGALYIESGTVDLTGTNSFSDNRAIGGDGGEAFNGYGADGADGGDGGDAYGGAIFLPNNTDLTITDGYFGGNFADGGDGGDAETSHFGFNGSIFATFTHTPETGGDGGRGGHTAGGAIYVSGGSVTMINPTDFMNNSVNSGRGGDGSFGYFEGGDGGAGGDAQGGAAFLDSVDAEFYGGTFSFNQADGGNGGDGGSQSSSSSSSTTFSSNQGAGFGGYGGQASGGAIFIRNGSLTLTNETITNNEADGGNGGSGGDGNDATTGGYGGDGGAAAGGGVFASSTGVTLETVTVSGNSAQGGDGGEGGDSGSDAGGYGGYGGGGFGGGLFADSGSLEITDSTISDNGAYGGRGGDGGRGSASDFGGNGGYGGEAEGAGIWSAPFGSDFSLTASTVSGNEAMGGRGGDGGDGGPSGDGSLSGGDAGHGGVAYGGGLFLQFATGSSTIESSTVAGNFAAGGDGGIGGNDGNVTTTPSSPPALTGGEGGSGGGSYGGGVFVNGSSTLSVLNSTLSGNVAAGGDGGNGGTGFSEAGDGGDGGDGIGGGLYTEDGTVLVQNSTLSTNSVSGGDGGNAGSLSNSGFGGNGGDAEGGGIYSEFATVNLRNSTVTLNSAVDAGLDGVDSSSSSPSSAGGDSFGGGLAGDSGIYNVLSSIVANNFADSGPDVSFFGVNDNGYNLIGDNDDNNFVEGNTNGSGSIVGSSAGGGIINPLLGPLADNGGPTLTHLPFGSSPAVDAGANPDSLAFDQRGDPFARVAGDSMLPDIGAVEVDVLQGTGFKLKTLRMTSNWRTPNKDRATLQAFMDNPGAIPAPRTKYPFAGSTVQINVGGQVYDFVLDAKGRDVGVTRNGKNLIVKYIKKTNQLLFVLKGPFGDYQDQWTDEGLTNDLIYGQNRTVNLTIQFDNTIVGGDVLMRWWNRPNSAGNAISVGLVVGPG